MIQVSKLDGEIPYSLIRGNHDLVNLNDDTGTDFMSEYMGTEYYRSQFENGGFYGDGSNISNSWRTMTIGDVDYLMLQMDFGPSDEVLAWANEVISTHPYHNVIISTHGYLNSDGTTLDANDAYAPSGWNQYEKYGTFNDGDYVWDKLIKKHKNIVLVLSGHISSDKIVVAQDEGENGNIVTQMLIDPQDMDSAALSKDTVSTGMVAMLYFSDNGRKVEVEYYSTGRNQFWLEENQFTKDLDTVEDVQTYKVEDYKGAEATQAYPKKEGKIFAGWYTDTTYTTPYTAITGEAVAKFVDEEVLTVKKQLNTKATSTSGTVDIRFMTAIDSLKFSCAGFDVKVACEPERNYDWPETLAFSSILVDGIEEPQEAATVFGTDDAEYFVLHSLTGIPEAVFDDTITVKPYWVTKDGTKVYGETRTFTINSEFKQNITLSENVEVGKDDADTFTIDLSKYSNILEGATLSSATLGRSLADEDKAFTTTEYSNDVMTLDTATLSRIGENTITATFKAKDNTGIVVTVPITVYTMVINNEAELNMLSEVIAQNKGAGHYVLGNDIICEGTYKGGNTKYFRGIFDGQGHIIHNMTTSADDTNTRGLFGQTVGRPGDTWGYQQAILRNVSFVNAKHAGKGGFITSSSSLVMENVYVQIQMTPNSEAWDKLFDALESIGYEGYYNFELGLRFAECIPEFVTELELYLRDFIQRAN